MRLYGSTKSIRLLEDLHSSLHRSRLTPIIDAEADLHIKKTWLASMKLLFQIQRETRRPMPRVMRRPIYAREMKKQMRKLDGFIKTLEFEPGRNDVE